MENENNNLLHQFDRSSKSSMFSSKFVVVLLAVVVLGIGTGYFLSRGSSNIVSVSQKGGSNNSGSISKGTVVGSDDLKTFKDEAEGVLKEGGIEGEGQFHLERSGGESQNVYLTSATVDLSQFVGKKIKVNGQTNTAKVAGWLMDVGRVEVLE